MRLFFLTAILILGLCPALRAGLATGELEYDPLEVRRTPVVKAIQNVAPSVVNITTAQVLEREVRPFGGLFQDDLFGQFFQDYLGGQVRRYTQQSLGSGVIIDGGEGLVLTNAHVISGATTISARLLAGRE